MDDNELLENERFIPQNVLTKGKVMMIDWIRWFEAAVFCALTIYIVLHTNFVASIKAIIIIVLCIAEAFLFLRGIKNRSVLQVIFEMILSRKERRHYKLGSVNDGRKTNKSIQSNHFGGESSFDRIVARIRYGFKQFDERYGEDGTVSKT